jgi:predicted nucleic acid-binding protein
MALTAGDIVFADTNIFLIATDRGRRGHQEARMVLGKARRAGIHLTCSGQVLREYLVVATRAPENNGLGLRPTVALANVEAFLAHVAFHEETEDVAVQLREIIRAGEVTGKRIHDANIVATLRAHGLSILLTENAADFKGFPDIRLVTVDEAARDVGDRLD